MVIDPCVQFKTIKGDPLPANGDFSEVGADVGVEAAPVHAEVARGVAKAQEPREDGAQPRRFLCFRHTGLSARGRRW